MTLVEVIREKQGRLGALRDEIAQLEAELREAKGLLSGHVSLAASPRQTKAKSRHGFTNGKRRKPIQTGSSVDWAQRVLNGDGGPLHIDRLITRILQAGGPDVKKPTLVSNLSRYIKHGDTFIRTAESTYGLLGRDKPADLLSTE